MSFLLAVSISLCVCVCVCVCECVCGDVCVCLCVVYVRSGYFARPPYECNKAPHECDLINTFNSELSQKELSSF